MMATKWNHESSHDTGNGAIVHTSRSASFPRTLKKEFRSYCGRDTNDTWYEIDGDPSRRHFASAAASERAAAQLRSLPTEALRAELIRRV